MIRAGIEARTALQRGNDRILLRDLAGGARAGRAILENVDRIAGALLARGARRIGLWYWNSLAAVEAFLAVEWVGGTRLPVDPHAAAAEANAVFAAGEIDLVLADRAHAAGLSGPVLVHDDAVIAPPAWPDIAVDPEKPILLYPRAVNQGGLFAIPVSYGNWRATLRTNIDLYRSGRYGPWLEESECFLAAQQIMHGTGFVGTFPFLEMGLPQILADSFEAGKILDAIERHGVTSTVLVPPMLSRLADAARDRPGAAASLRRITYGGGAIAPDELRRIMASLGPVLVQGYGRIEGGWPIAILDQEDHRAILAGDAALAASCGRPIDRMETHLRPVAGKTASCGELCVRGDMAVKEFTDAQGWCSLGDLMRVDERGYLYYAGRLDRMINTGYHIYPDEIEEVIAGVSGIAAVRVMGEPQPGGGEKLVAYLVPAPGETGGVLSERVRCALASRLAPYKMPRELRFVEALPPL